MSQRIIAHLDMDAFFASVEEVATLGFLGKPIVVGSSIVDGKGRGVVSTANYKARAYGIHSALPISIAWRLSEKAKSEGKPEAIFLPVDFELYNRVSNNIHKIIKKYAELVEQASIDEFYFDLSFLKTFKKAEVICKEIKEEIKKKERITCSIGLAPNKLISKIAAGINKPDGFLLIEDKNVIRFLNPLAIREISGIGPKTAEVLYSLNIQIIRDLNKLTKKRLIEMLGKQGEKIYYKVRGIDDDPVTEYHEIKSIGEQITFDENTLNINLICDSFAALTSNVFDRFTESEFSKFKNITITVRFADFETKTSSKSFKEGINQKKVLKLEVLRMLMPFLDKRSNPRNKLIRLIGVRVEKLVK
jgi:nucleotidyltransferase/DNA polymerase involved in DNA repair